MIKIIDTHCHPYLNKIKNKDDIINNFFSNSGESMIVIGTNFKSNNQVLELTQKNKKIYASIGIHPCDIGEFELKETIEKLEKIYSENKEKIVAIGECGLDYYWMYKDLENTNLNEEQKEDLIKKQKNNQKEFFRGQIELAKKLNLPIIIHNRDSRDDVFEILIEKNFKNFVFHCYSEDLEFALKLIDFAPNCKISFSGIVTFSNAKEIQETARNIPIKNILAETDSPYLTPTPFRGKEENEPIFTRYVIEKIAELRGEKLDYTANEIYMNSKIFFNI